MDTEIKENIIFGGIIVSLVLIFIVVMDFEYDECINNKEIIDNLGYWEDSVCYDGSYERTECEVYNKSLVKPYCETKYGGIWRWSGK